METKLFQERRNALAWARMHAREHCFPFHFWKVEQIDHDKFAVAVRSRNSGALCFYVPEDQCK